MKIKANPKSESLPDNATRLPVISPDSKNVSKECNIEKLKTTVTPSAPEKCCNSDIASTKSVSSQESKSYIDVVSDLSIKVQSKIDSYYVKKDDKINKNVVNVDKVDVPSELKNSVKPDKVRGEATIDDDTSQMKLKFRSKCEIKTESSSKDKRSSDKITLNDRKSRDISDYFTEKDRRISFNSALEKLNIERSRDQTKSCSPISSKGRKYILEKKKDRDLKSQPSINIFIERKKKTKDIAICTPGKRKFTEIQSIFEPKKHKGGTDVCTTVHPNRVKPVPGAKLDQLKGLSAANGDL